MMSTSASTGLLPYSVTALSSKAQDYHGRVKTFIKEQILPWEQTFTQHQSGNDKWRHPHKMHALMAKAKSQGLWNLFVPRTLDPEVKYGAGLTNVEYSFICEEMGKTQFAPEVFNCNPPDSGNIEVLIRYGTKEQQATWLPRLLDGKIRSCFAMTEPQVASSDATNIEATIDRQGNNYVINGRKWYITGGMHNDCKLCIFMGKTNPDAERHRQHSMVLIPMDAQGVTVVRPLTVFGYHHGPAGEAEILFDNVTVPVTNLLHAEGRGFEVAQGRLAPARIHHCMRILGHAERALDLMINRVQKRVAFGKPLAAQGTIQQDIAKSRCEIEQTRLLVLKAAHMLDTVGNKAAAPEIAMIKIMTPKMGRNVLDRAIQAHGAAGLSSDFPLAHMFSWARIMQIADGPDEVHLQSLAKTEFTRNKKAKL